jgi:hypothetical protein
MIATPQSLHEFVNYRLQYITGKERSQAQVFLDRFFQAFGHQGALQAGAEYEVAIAKGSNKGKTGFADLVWKPRVLIEMKTQGEDLGKHYRQAFNYWTRIVPNRPRYVMLYALPISAENWVVPTKQWRWGIHERFQRSGQQSNLAIPTY